MENLAVQENFSAEEKFLLIKNTLLTEIKNLTRHGTKTYILALNLVQQLDRDIKTLADAIIFCTAVKYVVAPLNRAMTLVPSDDKKFCEKCKDGWVVGISCKRTLRERWKQLSQADRGTLSHFKIRELWHLITFDKDLSDDKIVRLGEQGQIFYLPSTSETYKKCSEHPGMKNYVRPLSNFVCDIRKLI